MVRGRLAPSPTGALHLGNARTFLLAWLSIRAQGGTVVLRIEDLDGPRVKPETIAAALLDLRWLGLDWDEGPDVGGPVGPYVQTERLARYRQSLDRLIADRMAYPCYCSRKDIERAASAPHAGDEGPVYPGTCRDRLPAAPIDGRHPSWRFHVPPGNISFDDRLHGRATWNVARDLGDFVIWKGSGSPAYQLAVVVDDADMRIDEVVRGDDLLPSTPRQVLLYQALGLPPPNFTHVPLVIGPDGRRLAKRHGDTRIETFRGRGVTAERLVGLLAHWSGLADRITECHPADLIRRFAWELVPRHPVVCDEHAALKTLGAENRRS